MQLSVVILGQVGMHASLDEAGVGLHRELRSGLQNKVLDQYSRKVRIRRSYDWNVRCLTA